MQNKRENTIKGITFDYDLYQKNKTVQNKKIITVVLDWTLKQPVEVSLPKGSTLLKVLYVNKYDHLYVSADVSQPKETRKFIVKKTNDIIEESDNFEYVTSTLDEDNVVWHIFEIIKKKPRIPRDLTKGFKNDQ